MLGATGTDGGICDVPLVGGLPGQLQVVKDGVGGVVCPVFSTINNLADNLGISFQVVQGTVGGALPSGTLSQLLGGDGDIDLNLGVLQPGQSVKIDIIGTIANNVGNLIQGDVLNMSSDATLSQLP